MGKKLVIWFSILLVLLLLSLWFPSLARKKALPKEEPQNWISKKPGVVMVDVAKVTKGKGVWNENNQQYRVGSDFTAFAYEGSYHGDGFATSYLDENNRVRMRITQELKPNDGVLDGIIVERVVNNTVEAWIFLDNDWKQQVPNAVIWWGKTYERRRPFAWKELTAGVYVDMVVDDRARFNSDWSASQGGVLVGDMRGDLLDAVRTGTYIGIH